MFQYANLLTPMTETNVTHNFRIRKKANSTSGTKTKSDFYYFEGWGTRVFIFHDKEFIRTNLFSRGEKSTTAAYGEYDIRIDYDTCVGVYERNDIAHWLNLPISICDMGSYEFVIDSYKKGGIEQVLLDYNADLCFNKI